MRWRIPLVAVLALLVAVSCDQQPVAPQADEAVATPLFAPKSNANKFVAEWDFSFPFECSGGEILDYHAWGWGQFMPKKGAVNVEVAVFHFQHLYMNAAGDTFHYLDVGPDHAYMKDGQLYMAVTGRSAASGNLDRTEINIGHLVFKLNEFWEPIEIVFVAGKNLGVVDDLACDALT